MNPIILAVRAIICLNILRVDGKDGCCTERILGECVSGFHVVIHERFEMSMTSHIVLQCARYLPQVEQQVVKLERTCYQHSDLSPYIMSLQVGGAFLSARVIPDDVCETLNSQRQSYRIQPNGWIDGYTDVGSDFSDSLQPVNPGQSHLPSLAFDKKRGPSNQYQEYVSFFVQSIDDLRRVLQKYRSLAALKDLYLICLESYLLG